MALILAALVLPAAAGMWLVLAGSTLRARTAYALAVVVGIATLVAVVGVVATDAEMDRIWIRALDVRWSFAADAISGPLLILTAAITLLVVLHAGRHLPGGGSPGLFFGSILLVELGALATFLTRDVIVFFVAFEIVLVPMWVLISRFGDAHDLRARADAAGRFVLYTVVGSTVMLVGILALVSFAGTSDMRRIPAAALTPTEGLIAALLLVAGLGVKVPLFPVHTWLPPAHTIAPTGGSVLLAAILLKMGTYGLIRLPVGMTPEGFARVAPGLAVLGAIGILWGGLVCLVERDLKRLIAYSSVAHMGFVALALGSGSALGVQAAVITNIAHGVVSALLFFIVGGLKERWGSADLSVVRPALREVWPGFGFALVVGLAASLGLPGLATFWGEFFALAAAWSGPDLAYASTPAGPTVLLRVCMVLGAVGAALAAAYALRVARLVWVGDRADPDPANDMTGVERVVVGTLVVATVALGLVPGLITPTAGLLTGWTR